MSEANTKIIPDIHIDERETFRNLSTETREALRRAGIVLVPDDGFHDYAGPVFPQGTVDFLEFLREHAPSDTAVAIAAEDANYREVVLHFDVVRLATIFVEYGAAPIAMSLIAAYLKDLLGSRFGSAKARAEIVVYDNRCAPIRLAGHHSTR